MGKFTTIVMLMENKTPFTVATEQFSMNISEPVTILELFIAKVGRVMLAHPAHPVHPVHPDPGYHNPEPSYHTQGHHAPEPHYSHPPAQYHHTEPAHHISGHSHHSSSAGFGSGFSFPKGFGGNF